VLADTIPNIQIRRSMKQIVHNMVITPIGCVQLRHFSRCIFLESPKERLHSRDRCGAYPGFRYVCGYGFFPYTCILAPSCN
jgi:hypothetical protein